MAKTDEENSGSNDLNVRPKVSILCQFVEIEW